MRSGVFLHRAMPPLLRQRWIQRAEAPRYVWGSLCPLPIVDCHPGAQPIGERKVLWMRSRKATRKNRDGILTSCSAISAQATVFPAGGSFASCLGAGALCLCGLSTQITEGYINLIHGGCRTGFRSRNPPRSDPDVPRRSVGPYEGCGE